MSSFLAAPEGVGQNRFKNASQSGPQVAAPGEERCRGDKPAGLRAQTYSGNGCMGLPLLTRVYSFLGCGNFVGIANRAEERDGSCHCCVMARWPHEVLRHRNSSGPPSDHREMG